MKHLELRFLSSGPGIQTIRPENGGSLLSFSHFLTPLRGLHISHFQILFFTTSLQPFRALMILILRRNPAWRRFYGVSFLRLDSAVCCFLPGGLRNRAVSLHQRYRYRLDRSGYSAGKSNRTQPCHERIAKQCDGRVGKLSHSQPGARSLRCAHRKGWLLDRRVFARRTNGGPSSEPESRTVTR